MTEDDERGKLSGQRRRYDKGNGRMYFLRANNEENQEKGKKRNEKNIQV
jgi:hypothetical protein